MQEAVTAPKNGKSSENDGPHITSNKDIETEKRICGKQSSALLMLTTFLFVIELSACNGLTSEYYILSRVINFSNFALVALFANEVKDTRFAIIFGIMAFLFNPVHPFFLTGEIWIIADIIALLVMWYYLIFRIKFMNILFNKDFVCKS